MALTLPAAETLDLAADRPGSLIFSGSPEADLFTREVAESLAGVLRENLITRRTADGSPPGFTRASVPPRPWWDTMWTRDAGTFLRELVAWGYFEHGCLVSHCLIQGVALNHDGYHAFPEKLRPGQPEAGDEIDGTAAIIIGMVLLWRHLPAGHPFREPLDLFLHGPSSPVRYLRFMAKRDGLIAGTGEFGPGCSLDGSYCSVVQNHLAALALQAAGNREDEAGRPTDAAEFRAAAYDLVERISAIMRYPDGSWMWGVRPDTHQPDPQILDAPINRGSGLHNGVASMYADVLGLDPVGAGWSLADACRKTFDRLLAAPLRRSQFEKYGFWPQWDPPFRGGLSSGPSYGEGYALQTMLLFDCLDLADKSLRWLAKATFEATPQPFNRLHRDSPYHFYERTYSPDAEGRVDFEEGCGALNLVNVTEPLKVARLMLGVDPTARGKVQIAPRLPRCISRIEARNWPVLTETGVVQVNLEMERIAAGLAFKCTAVGAGVIPHLVLRSRSGGTSQTEEHRDVRSLSVVLPS